MKSEKKRIESKPVLNLNISGTTNPTKRPYNQRKRLGGVVVSEKEKASGFGLAWLPQQPVAVASGRSRHSTVTTASAKAATSNSGEGQFQTGAGHVKRTFTGILHKVIV